VVHLAAVLHALDFDFDDVGEPLDRCEGPLWTSWIAVLALVRLPAYFVVFVAQTLFERVGRLPSAVANIDNAVLCEGGSVRDIRDLHKRPRSLSHHLRSVSLDAPSPHEFP